MYITLYIYIYACVSVYDFSVLTSGDFLRQLQITPILHKIFSILIGWHDHNPVYSPFGLAEFVQRQNPQRSI